jgi:hypothetical protein
MSRRMGLASLHDVDTIDPDGCPAAAASGSNRDQVAMDRAVAERLIRSYIEGWRAGDRDKILSTLAPECVIIESYGPAYTGVDKIARWIDTWLGAGNTVDRWEVTSLDVAATACFFEWEFECTFAGSRSGFLGASIARFRDERIVSLREYKMTDTPSEWEPPDTP